MGYVQFFLKGVRNEVIPGKPRYYQTNDQSGIHNTRLTKSRTSLELTSSSKLYSNKTATQNVNLKQPYGIDGSTKNASLGQTASSTLNLESFEELPDVSQFQDVSFQKLLKKIASGKWIVPDSFLDLFQQHFSYLNYFHGFLLL